jgi:biotin-(acetyl-CoA carboxylase) ligase
MMKQVLVPALPSTSGSSGKGRFSRNFTVRSVGALISSTTVIIARPNVSRLPQRPRLATTSLASTGSPVWKRKPSRSVSTQVVPSSSMAWPSTICGCGTRFSSHPYSVSQTSRPWLRVTKPVDQIGSSTARLAWATNFSVRVPCAAARRGAASSAAEAASRSRRRIAVSLPGSFG